MGVQVPPRSGPPPSGSDSRFASARVPRHHQEVLGSLHRATQNRACPAPPPTPLPTNSPEATGAISASADLRAGLLEPGPRLSFPIQIRCAVGRAEGAAVKEHVRRRDEDACRTGRPASVRWPLSQPRRAERNKADPLGCANGPARPTNIRICRIGVCCQDTGPSGCAW